MRSLSLYQQGDSILHKLDPLTKILYIVVALALPSITVLVKVSIACIISGLLLITFAKVLKNMVPIVSFSTIVILTIFIIQGMFYYANENVLFTLGPMTFYREGMLYALKIGLRIYNIITSVSLLVLTTRPSDLIEALVRKGLSPKIGYVLSSILQIIPQMTTMMNTITDAQRARGMETEGSLLVRMKAFIPLLGPMVMSSLVGTRERAMALEVRAFSSSRKKTFLNKPMESAQSTIWRVVLLIILIGAVIWRVTS